MNEEALERLMLDCGLGVLPADCEALLDAFLQTRPDAAAACGRITRTVDLARAVLAGRPADDLPPFPAERLRQAWRSSRAWKMAGGLVGVAASILVGFAMHAVLLPAAVPRPNPVGPSAVARASAETRLDTIADDSGFWSARRLYEERATAQPTQQSSRRLIWRSPAEVPEIGGST